MLQADTVFRIGSYFSSVRNKLHSHPVFHPFPAGAAAFQSTVHQKGVPFDGNRAMFRTSQAGREVQSPFTSGSQMDKHDIPVTGNKILTTVVHAFQCKSRISHRITQIETAAVTGGPAIKSQGFGFGYRSLRLIGKVYVQRAQRLVRSIPSIGFLLLRDKTAIHQFLCFTVLPLKQQLADGRQAFRSIGVTIVRFHSTPQGDFIQDDVLPEDPSVGHHSQTPVAQRKGLFPYGSRLGIIKPVVTTVNRSIGCTERQSDRKQQ